MGAIPVPLAVMGSPKCWQVETLMYFGGGFVLRSARSWYGLDVTYSPSFYLTLSGYQVWYGDLQNSFQHHQCLTAQLLLDFHPPNGVGMTVVLLTYLPPVLQCFVLFGLACGQHDDVGLWVLQATQNSTNLFGHFLWWASLFQSCACYLVTR